MTDAQQREAARQFYYRWNKKGNEDEDARSYWLELLGAPVSRFKSAYSAARIASLNQLICSY